MSLHAAPADVPKAHTSISADVLRMITSAFICIVLLSQLVIGFSYHGGQAYPILSYPMFSRAHYDGERFNDLLVYASADGGPEEVYDPETMELDFALYQRVVAIPLTRGEKRDVALGLVASACRKHQAKVVTLNVYDSGYHISRNGAVGVGKNLLSSADFAC